MIIIGRNIQSSNEFRINNKMLPLIEVSTIQVIPRATIHSGYNNVFQAKQANTSLFRGDAVN